MAKKKEARGTVREAAPGYGVTEVPASELKNDWHRWLMRVAEGGQTIIVTRYGRPVATLSPARPEGAPRRIFGAMAGTVVRSGDLIAPTGERWDAQG